MIIRWERISLPLRGRISHSLSLGHGRTRTKKNIHKLYHRFEGLDFAFSLLPLPNTLDMLLTSSFFSHFVTRLNSDWIWINDQTNKDFLTNKLLKRHAKNYFKSQFRFKTNFGLNYNFTTIIAL